MGLRPRRGLGATGDRPERVDRIAARMAGQDNALMRRAAATGLQTANRRGLGNSSIAVGASQSAVLDQVIPMASQVAQQNFQHNAARDQFGYQRSLNRQTNRMEAQGDRRVARLDRINTAAESDLQRQQNRQLSRLDRGENRQVANLDRRNTEVANRQAANLDLRNTRAANRQLSQLDRGENRQIADLELRNQSERVTAQGRQERIGARLDNRLQEGRMQLETQLQARLARLRLTSESRAGAETMLTNFFNDHEQSLASILANPDLPANERNRLIQSAQSRLETKIGLIEQVHSFTFDWPDNIFGQRRDGPRGGGPRGGNDGFNPIALE